MTMLIEPLRSRRPWPNTWILWTGVALYALFGWLGVDLSERFRFLSDSPGDAPPWYFIRKDAIQGLCLLAYFLTCLSIGVVAMRKKVEGGAMLIWFSLIWALAPIWQMMIIFLKSDHVFDPANARTSWPTHDSYLSDPHRWGWLLIGAAFVLYVTWARRGSGNAGLAR
jgi:hypothetical protein